MSFFKMVILFPARMNKSNSCSTPLSTLGIISLLNFGYSGGCMVVYYLILGCISLQTNGFKHVFMYLFPIHISSLFKSFANFLLGCLYSLELKEIFRYSEYKSFSWYDLQIFSPKLYLAFSFS